MQITLAWDVHLLIIGVSFWLGICFIAAAGHAAEKAVQATAKILRQIYKG